MEMTEKSSKKARISDEVYIAYRQGKPEEMTVGWTRQDMVDEINRSCKENKDEHNYTWQVAALDYHFTRLHKDIFHYKGYTVLMRVLINRKKQKKNAKRTNK